MLDKLLNRWHGTAAYRNYAVRDAGERTVILLVLGLIVASLLYLLLWQPLANYSANAEQSHTREQTLNDWLLANENNARQAKKKGPTTSPTEGLLTIVSRTADKAQLKLTRFQPDRDGVSVVLQKQAFNDVLRWLDMLEKEAQVQVVQASVDADALSGRVNARFSLRR